MIPRFVNLPWLLQAGLALLALGGAGDILYHSFSGLPVPLGYALHLLTFVGMAITVVGVLVEAFSTGKRDPKCRVEGPISSNRIKT